jgi:hypothetical protein
MAEARQVACYAGRALKLKDLVRLLNPNKGHFAAERHLQDDGFRVAYSKFLRLPSLVRSVVLGCQADARIPENLPVLR